MKKLGILLGCFMIALLALTVAQAFGDEIVVGVLVPLTKKGASYGVQSNAATQLAVEEINAKGGIVGKKLTVITLDTEGDNALAIQLARQLIDKNKVLTDHAPAVECGGGSGLPYFSGFTNLSSMPWSDLGCWVYYEDTLPSTLRSEHRPSVPSGGCGP